MVGLKGSFDEPLFYHQPIGQATTIYQIISLWLNVNWIWALMGREVLPNQACLLHIYYYAHEFTQFSIFRKNSHLFILNKIYIHTSTTGFSRQAGIAKLVSVYMGCCFQHFPFRIESFFMVCLKVLFTGVEMKQFFTRIQRIFVSWIGEESSCKFLTFHLVKYELFIVLFKFKTCLFSGAMI